MCSDGIERLRYLYADLPAAHKTAINNSVYDTYGLTPVAQPTVKYNCHSYAWYQQSTANIYWISNAEPFLVTRGRKNADSVLVGNKVVYFASKNGSYQEMTHSGVVIGVGGSGAKWDFTIRSKWGRSGLYEHSLTNCPYYYYDNGEVSCPLDYAFYS